MSAPSSLTTGLKQKSRREVQGGRREGIRRRESGGEERRGRQMERGDDGEQGGTEREKVGV